MFKYFIVFILATFAFFFVGSSSLDLGRYYEGAMMLDENTNIITFAVENFKINFDFIYYTSFLIIKKIGLPIQSINFLYVGLYYFMSLKILDLYTNNFRKASPSIINFIVIFMITSVGVYIIFSISRNLAGISFFLIGLYLLLKKKKYFFIFWILSIFTHTGMFLYISIFAVFYFVIPYPKKLNNKLLIILLVTSMFFLGRFLPTILVSISNLPFFDSYSRYLSYTEIDDNLDLFTYLAPVETIFYYYFALILFIFFLFLKQYNKVIWAGFGVFLFLVLSFDFSVMFVQRSIMFLLPFQGILAVCIYKENYNKRRNLDFYLLIMTFSIILFFGYLYSYRGNEMFLM